jgi:WD40 repeat protein
MHMNAVSRTSRHLLLLLFIVQSMFGFASEQNTLAQFEPSVVKIAWSADGNLQAVGYDDQRTVEIRNAATGQIVRTLEVSHFEDIAWSPLAHPELLAVSDLGGNIWIFDVTTGNVAARIEDHLDSDITTVAWSPDGTRLAAGHVMGGMKGESARGIPKVWDATTGQLLMTFDDSPHRYRVNSVAWSPDGARIASAGTERVIIWNTVSGVEDASLEVDEVRRVAWSPDGGRLITGGFSFSVGVWDANTYQFLSSIETDRTVNEIAWRPDGQQIAILLSDKLLIVDGNTYEILYESSHNPVTPRGMAWSPDGNLLVYGLEDRIITVKSPVSGPDSPPEAVPDPIRTRKCFCE